MNLSLSLSSRHFLNPLTKQDSLFEPHNSPIIAAHNSLSYSGLPPETQIKQPNIVPSESLKAL